MLDHDPGERPGQRLVLGGQLDVRVDEEAVRHHRSRAVDDRHEEGVGLEDRPYLRVHGPEDLRGIERHADRVSDLDEGREQAGPPLGDEPRADVQIAEDEERDAREEEPGLNEDDLDRDDRGQAPEELRPAGADEPAPALLEHRAPQRDEKQVQLREVHRDEHQDGHDRRRDRGRHVHAWRQRAPQDRVHERRDAARDRDGCGVADDLLGPLAGQDVVRQSGEAGHDRDHARRQEYDAGDDRDVRWAEVGVGVDPNGPGREEDSRGVEAAHQPELDRHQEERDRADGEERHRKHRRREDQRRRRGATPQATHPEQSG